MIYTLSDFLKEYMFVGSIRTRGKRSNFDVKINQYDMSTGKVMGSTEDRRGKTSINGIIIPDSPDCAKIILEQKFSHSSKKTVLNGNITRTSQNLVLTGTYRTQEGKYRFNLGAERKEECPTPRWTYRISAIVFPKAN